MARWGMSLTLLLGFIGSAGQPARGAVLLVSDRSELGASDYVDWGVFGPAFTLVPSPSPAASNSGELIVEVAQRPGEGEFMRLDEGHGWTGDFAPGERLLWTSGTTGAAINFSAPVRGVGTRIQGEFMEDFVATIRAYDPSGMELAEFSVTAPLRAPREGSSVYIGLLGTALIDRIELDGARPDGSRMGFAINQLDLTPFPEPRTSWLLGMGLATALGWQLSVRRSTRHRS